MSLVIAVHEAGHALIAEACGLAVGSVAVGRYEGVCHYAGLWGPHVSRLRVATAGYVAEAVALDAPLRLKGSDADNAWAQARALRATIPRDRRGDWTIRRLRQQEIDTVHYYLQRHRAQLIALANAILDVEPDADGVRRMNGDRVRDLLGTVEPLPPKMIVVPPMPASMRVSMHARPSPSRPWKQSIAASAARRRAS